MQTSSMRRRIWETRCRWPTGTGGSPGSVTSTRSSTRRRSSSAASSSAVRRSEQRLERLAHLVGLLADRPALLRRQLADRAQRLGQLGLAPEVAHAQLLELGRRAGGADGGLGLGAQLVRGQPWPAILLAASYSATVAAIATLSDSGPSARADPHARRARARRGSPPRSAPRQSTSGGVELGLAQASAARARSSASGRPGARRARPAPAAARTATPCWRARPSARTGRRSPGPRITGPSASAWAERMIVPDVAGVLDRVQPHAQRRRRARPSAARRRRSRGCPSRAR